MRPSVFVATKRSRGCLCALLPHVEWEHDPQTNRIRTGFANLLAKMARSIAISSMGLGFWPPACLLCPELYRPFSAAWCSRLSFLLCLPWLASCLSFTGFFNCCFVLAVSAVFCAVAVTLVMIPRLSKAANTVCVVNRFIEISLDWDDYLACSLGSARLLSHRPSLKARMV